MAPHVQKLMPETHSRLMMVRLDNCHDIARAQNSNILQGVFLNVAVLSYASKVVPPAAYLKHKHDSDINPPISLSKKV